MDFEELDRYAKMHHVDLSRNEFLAATIGDKEIRTESAELQHYRNIKGSAISLMTRYIFREGDAHAQNMSKDGKMVDFELTKNLLSIPLKMTDQLSAALLSSRKTSFACTARDIRSFPDLVDAEPFYWPTIQTRILPSIMKIISGYLHGADDDSEWLFDAINELKASFANALISDRTNFINRKMIEHSVSVVVDEKLILLRDALIELIAKKDNKIEVAEMAVWNMFGKAGRLFSDADNKLYSNLSYHPVFEYHKFKTLLKLLVLDPDVYHCMAEFHISADARIMADETEEARAHIDGMPAPLFVGLRNLAALDDIARRSEIQNVLVTMPEFNAYIAEYGEEAMHSILEEVNEVRVKYASKLVDKPHYQRMVDALNPDKMNLQFAELQGRNALVRQSMRA
jgi:hypothetical protein